MITVDEINKILADHYLQEDEYGNFMHNCLRVRGVGHGAIFIWKGDNEPATYLYIRKEIILKLL